MAKYRKKPVEIEAWRFTEYGLQNAPQWLVQKFDAGDVSINTDWTNYMDSQTGAAKRTTLSIATLEGVMTAQEGDYIVQGVRGEIYPCKPDIFEQTYEAVK